MARDDRTDGNFEQLLHRTLARISARVRGSDFFDEPDVSVPWFIFDAAKTHPRIVSQECARTLALLECASRAGFVPRVPSRDHDLQLTSLIQALLSAYTTALPRIGHMSGWSLGLAHTFLRRVDGRRRGKDREHDKFADGAQRQLVFGEWIQAVEMHAISKPHRSLMAAIRQAYRVQEETDWLAFAEENAAGLASQVSFQASLAHMLEESRFRSEDLSSALWAFSTLAMGTQTQFLRLREVLSVLSDAADAKTRHALRGAAAFAGEGRMIMYDAVAAMDPEHWAVFDRPSSWQSLTAAATSVVDIG